MGKYKGKPHNNSGIKYQKNKFHGQQYKKDNDKFKGENRTVPKISLREDQVGILEYISSTTAGFTAVIKSRYTDFHVNEIDLNDKVLILDDLNIPKPAQDCKLNADDIDAVRKAFTDIINEDMWKGIEQLAETSKLDADSKPIEININELTKEKRTEIHALIKQLFAGKLVSTTVNKDTTSGEQERFIQIAKAKGGRAEKRVKWSFPGEYVNFLVHKENVDTAEVATHMAKHLSLTPSKVNYCGTKDKRAVTTQMFCVKRRSPSDIVASIRSLRNVHIGNFSFSEKVLKLGELNGNRFRIALRHISVDTPVIEQALQQLKDHGFINYFGLQRFGNSAEVATYEVGIALMKADYKRACELILKPRSADPPFLKDIRETWWKNRDSKAAAAMFRSDRFIEKKLLDGLAKHGENDFATALRKLPRNLLMLYPHAFQSLIFNRIASQRVKKYGLQLMPGDLVYCGENIVDEQEILEDIVTDNAEDECNNSNQLLTTEDKHETEDDDKERSAFKVKVQSLTTDDIASGKYTIYDVVLPLPGYEIQYPDNELREWYIEEMNQYELTSEALNHSVKTFKLSGAYRKMIVHAKNLNWEFCCYDKTDAQLIKSDWDIIKGFNCPNRFPISDFDSNSSLQRALLLDFCLPPASYATMLLRELLKADTSSSNQTLVENQAKLFEKEKNLVVGSHPNSTENRSVIVNLSNTMDRKLVDQTDKGEAPTEIIAEQLKTDAVISNNDNEDSPTLAKLRRTC